MQLFQFVHDKTKSYTALNDKMIQWNPDLSSDFKVKNKLLSFP